MTRATRKQPQLNWVEWRLFIPGDPVEQARPRMTTAGGYPRLYDTKRVGDYKAYVKATIAANRPMELLMGPLGMNISVRVQRRKSWPKKKLYPDTKPDLDNYIKLICDCLEGIVYPNDSRIVSLHALKGIGDVPGVSVAVYQIESSNDPIRRGGYFVDEVAPFTEADFVYLSGKRQGGRG